jgi:hypothetical protein
MRKSGNRQWGRNATRFGVACFGIGLLSGCMSLESEEGRLPAAMRTAINTFTAKGYPDLTKVPDAPTNVPTPATWTALENGLVDQGKILSRDPAARPPAANETNLSWAERERQALTSDPRAEPVPPVPVQGSSEAVWAAEAKAKLDADIARLPPL